MLMFHGHVQGSIRSIKYTGGLGKYGGHAGGGAGGAGGKIEEEDTGIVYSRVRAGCARVCVCV